MFLLLTLMAIPILVFYGSNDAYKEYTKGANDTDILINPGNEIFSLGNLGYASTQCVHAPLNVGSFSLSCQYGSIGKIMDYGVNNAK